MHRLRNALRGRLVEPSDTGYGEARRVYNAAIDRAPAAIAQCADVADIVATVNFAREHQLRLAVRGGGHNGAGFGTCDDGIVLDLAGLKRVEVDAQAAAVRVQGGGTWADVDRATQPFGLAVPSGIIGTTGVGGLTLGGGIGHLTRRFGLTIDNLLEAEVVLADGSVVTTSAHEHADLFWALRGGGGNFGVVTSFLFRGHALEKVVAGVTLWPAAEAARMLRWYERFLAAAPLELSGFFSLHQVSPTEQSSKAMHRMPVCGVVWCWCGEPGEANAVLEPAAKLGPPLLHSLQEMPYATWQGAFDPLFPSGMHWLWRADFVDDLSDGAIAEHMRFGTEVPTWRSFMHLYPIDGAAHGVGRTHTPFAARSSRWVQLVAGIAEGADEVPAAFEWCQRYHEALRPHAAASAYTNMLMEEGPERVRAAYRENYDRLVALKRRYDPGNLFRVNQNVPLHPLPS